MKVAPYITVRSKCAPDDLFDFWFARKQEAVAFIEAARKEGFEITDADEMLLHTAKEAMQDLRAHEFIRERQLAIRSVKH